MVGQPLAWLEPVDSVTRGQVFLLPPLRLRGGSAPFRHPRALTRGSHAARADLTFPTATARAGDRLLSAPPPESRHSAVLTGSGRVPGLPLSPPVSRGKGCALSLACVGPSSALAQCDFRAVRVDENRKEWLPKEIREAVPRERSHGCGGQQQMNVALKIVLCRRQVVHTALHCGCL